MYGKELAKIGFTSERGHHLVEWSDHQNGAMYFAVRLPKGREVFAVMDIEGDKIADKLKAGKLIDGIDRAFTEEYHDEGKRADRPDLKERIQTRVDTMRATMAKNALSVPGQPASMTATLKPGDAGAGGTNYELPSFPFSFA